MGSHGGFQKTSLWAHLGTVLTGAWCYRSSGKWGALSASIFNIHSQDTNTIGGRIFRSYYLMSSLHNQKTTIRAKLEGEPCDGLIKERARKIKNLSLQKNSTILRITWLKGHGEKRRNQGRDTFWVFEKWANFLKSSIYWEARYRKEREGFHEIKNFW